MLTIISSACRQVGGIVADLHKRILGIVLHSTDRAKWSFLIAVAAILQTPFRGRRNVTHPV